MVYRGRSAEGEMGINGVVSRKEREKELVGRGAYGLERSLRFGFKVRARVWKDCTNPVQRIRHGVPKEAQRFGN